MRPGVIRVGAVQFGGADNGGSAELVQHLSDTDDGTSRIAALQAQGYPTGTACAAPPCVAYDAMLRLAMDTVGLSAGSGERSVIVVTAHAPADSPTLLTEWGATLRSANTSLAVVGVGHAAVERAAFSGLSPYLAHYYASTTLLLEDTDLAAEVAFDLCERDF